MQLLDNASATGDWVQWGGGHGFFSVAGTFDGATVSLEFLGPDGTTAIAAGTSTTVTAAAGASFALPPGRIRASVTGGTSPTGLYAQAEHLK